MAIALSILRLHADPTGVETLGSARFTVITPQLIRMEYAPDGKFVDAPSWFARNRSVRNTGYKAQQDAKTLTIDTGAIRLVYADDGKSFGPDNLQAEVKTAAGVSAWKAGMESPRNLGGANVALDRVRAAEELEPGLLSRDGWFVLNDSDSVLVAGDWYQARPPGHGIDWYFFGYGADYKAALKSLTTVSGEIPLPRKYTLGIWYSRNWSYKADDFKQIVGEYRQHDFPLDAIVMDYQWHLKGWTGYTWNPQLIPDPAALLQWFHEQGIAVTLNDHPDEGVQPKEAMYAGFMKAMGQDPASKQTLPFDGGDKKYLETFYDYTHLPLMKQGVDFWWLDWRNPKTTSLPEMNGLSLLNEHTFQMTAIDGKRGQSFSRWGGWGDQRYPINFSGDTDTGWKMLAFEIAFTSTSGNSDCFFWSHDTGGYRGGRNEESYTRWCQFSALSAALRSHSSPRADTDRRPWTYPQWATDSMRIAFHLRASLIPYVYTSAEQAVKESVPFIRPLYIDHPAEEEAYHNGQEYYFGDNLLVSLIASPGQGANHLAWQHVWFPGGTWYQYFTGEKYTGPSHVLAAADIDEIPLFVRGGTPLPEQPYSERPTSVPLKNLVLRCFPGTDGQKGTSSLYEDDGISDEYKKGGSATTELSYSRQGDEITVRVAPTQGGYQGEVKSRAYTILLPDTRQGILQAPANAKLAYDAATGMNRIDVPEAPIGQETVVKVTAADLDPALVRERAETRRLDGLLGKPYAQWSDADRAALPPGVDEAVQAIHGIGLMPVNQQSYLYGNDVKLVYFDPSATQPMSGTLSFKSWSAPVTVANGQPIDLAGVAQAIAPVDTISVPGIYNRLLLKLNGRDAAAGLNPAAIAYQLGDLALGAKLTTSSGHGEPVIDGVADGAPGHPENEWSVVPDPAGGAPNAAPASVKLTWANPIKAKRILLYDHPSAEDQILAGKLTFSDGSSVAVGALPNDGKTPADIAFPEKQFTWVRFDITQSSPTTKNTGLAEVGVFDR